jgi:SAM-dependent methyltransferase
MSRESLDEVISDFSSLLDPGAAAFLQRVYRCGLEPYRRRLKAHGFSGHGRVLDAGCGFGQWTLALAGLDNREVVAIDQSAERLLFVRRALAATGQTNVMVRRARLDRVPDDLGTFDAIFCYSVLPWTPWRQVIPEIARSLRPGGLLYVNAQGFGWYKFLWDTGHNATADYDPRLVAGQALCNTVRYDQGLPPEPGRDVLIEPDALKQALIAAGLIDLRLGAEGSVFLESPDAEPIQPFFAGQYEGCLGVYEILARAEA